MKATTKLFFRTLVLIIFTGLVSAESASGSDLQKTYTWKYNINKDGSVALENYECNVTIHTWDKGETEFRLTIDAKTRSDEDAGVLDKYLQNLKFSNSATSVSFKDSFWESRNNLEFLNWRRMTMKLEGGKVVSLSEFSMKGELWIPSGCRFGLNSKYSKVNMEDFSGQLILDLYNDNFYGSNLSGRTTIEDKYSAIEFKDTRDLKADLYNSKFEAGNTGDLNIESKYSKVTALSTGILIVDSYNDNYSIPKTGDISFVAKYSTLNTETSGMTNLDCYEGTVIIKEARDIKITSKYADFQFGKVENVSIESSYNDKLSAAKMKAMGIIESKYCSFRIEELANSIVENDGYEDKIVIVKTGQEFSKMSVDGKYVDISLSLPKTLDYRFKAKINYPNLDIDESKFVIRTKISNGSQLEYDAVKGTEKDGMPVIEVNGYQMSLNIIGI
jgi:hypothetical protein